MLCDIASVSRSGYYAWLKQSNTPDKDYDDYLAIRAVFEKGKKKYGWRRIKMHFPRMNHKKIQRIMGKYGLRTKVRRKNPYKQMMRIKQESTVFPNVLKRAFQQSEPYTVLCTDITYMPLGDHFAYLSVIKDIASGEIVAWNTSKRIDTALVTDTLLLLPDCASQAIIHSDQGFQYTNYAYRDAVHKRNMIPSMSARGVCLDNASIESFFGHMKDEIEYNRRNTTFAELSLLIDNYMQYYNQKRKQWTRNKMTPVQYREYLYIQQG